MTLAQDNRVLEYRILTQCQLLSNVGLTALACSEVHSVEDVTCAIVVFELVDFST